MKRFTLYLLPMISLVAGCVVSKSDRRYADVGSQVHPCVSEAIPSEAELEDVEGTYILKSDGRDLVYQYKGIDISLHPECTWTLKHLNCAPECCSYRNMTTSATFHAVVTNGMLVVRKKAGGRNLGLEPMLFKLNQAEAK